MSYKGFIIEPKAVDVCVDFGSNGYVVTGNRTAYRIFHSATKLMYGFRSTLELAQKAIDKNGERWLKSKL
ncbi:hypothetical protein [Spirosoma agri]|uniref:Uncharacterized protein n=1 Tax=Spirosoma agri TaxID=1987381 RepID=A0A6M0IH52_9BACT|nr:hypothetical protein [Spirosoma agri]NEU67162.1 hypothetical protein [Spirosoma agri]